jgi:hypothetical protein
MTLGVVVGVGVLLWLVWVGWVPLCGGLCGVGWGLGCSLYVALPLAERSCLGFDVRLVCWTARLLVL